MRHLEVEVIGGEDEDGVAGRELVEGGAPGGGVVLVVGGEGLEGGVEAVALGDEAVEVGADGGEFGAVAAGEDDVVNESVGAEIEEGEGDDACALVGGGFGAVDEAGDVFSGAEDEDFHGDWGEL